MGLEAKLEAQHREVERTATSLADCERRIHEQRQQSAVEVAALTEAQSAAEARAAKLEVDLAAQAELASELKEKQHATNAHSAEVAHSRELVARLEAQQHEAETRHAEAAKAAAARMAGLERELQATHERG